MSGIEKIGKGGSPWPEAGERKVAVHSPSLALRFFPPLGSMESHGLFLPCLAVSVSPTGVCRGRPNWGRLLAGRAGGGALSSASRT